ncbi:lysophospholipid acyltransferase family protein [Pseudooceanicola aestuarii]|uniref:lysophospholipid acyltransferase family protein n=1 Tax=Pseudooceanicola aestuarii TaxID=2697319 RepID=UPI001953D386|nr:lysophospholipid acyltransferase family protein [Pseudooceanicola aestuarii]
MAAEDARPSRRVRLGEYALNLALRGLLLLALALPYRLRVRFMGGLVSRVVAPLAGWRRRIRNNLALVWPDLPEDEIRKLEQAVPDNAGRTLIEIYSGRQFRNRIRDLVPEGPGLAAVDTARAEGRAVLFVSGHFGNYDAFRAAMSLRYGEVGALYRPMNNRYFNRHYVDAMESVAEPMFARGRRGLAEMVRFMREGRAFAMLGDQHFASGAPLDFLGQPAMTALSAAEMALKYNALLVPIYGIRQPDGLTFRVLVEDPVTHSTAEEMTQALNNSLARMTEAHPEQWFWIHRRWK